MDVPLQVTFRDMAHTAELEERIRDGAQRLCLVNPGINTFRVTLERRHGDRRQPDEFAARIDLRMPDCDIVANHDHDADPRIALREAFAAAERQLRTARAGG